MRVLPLLLLMGLCSVAFADTYNNFTGSSPYWNPLGYPNTATYGETFTAPTDGQTDLTDFGFYFADPTVTGDIVLSAYIAPWLGTMAGTPVYVSPSTDYANTGSAFLSFNTGGLDLAGGVSYVAFLSISQYYGQSAGEAQVDAGTAIPVGSFVYYNNAGNYSELFTTPWNATGLQPNWAVNLDLQPHPLSRSHRRLVSC